MAERSRGRGGALPSRDKPLVALRTPRFVFFVIFVVIPDTAGSSAEAPMLQGNHGD